MKGEELETWFEAEKDRLEQEYAARIKEGIPEESSRALFDDGMQKALEKYTEESEALVNPEGARKLQTKWNKTVVDRIYAFMNKLTGAFKER